MVSSYTKSKCGNNCELFSAENDMDPMSVPVELQNLTFIEKQLIARIHTVMSLYKFKKCQYKYSGQVINFSQDVQSVATKLPHLIADINNVVVVKLTDNIVLQDFVVRKAIVLRALIWLKANNPSYSDIQIDYKNLDSLPIEGNVYGQLKKIETDMDFPDEIEDNEDDTTKDNDENSEIKLSYTDVPELMDSSLKKSLDNVVIWPSIGKTPIIEFSSPGFISLAFPHLFPYGKADFSMGRKHKISLQDYIRHLMLYSDSRFAQDERFRYFIMNCEMRWTALNIGNIYVKKNSFFSKMTIVQLKDFLKKNPSLVNQVMHYGSRLRTTKAYWKSRCGELLDMVNQLGTPTVFFTLSSADFHWPDLYRLLGHDVKNLTMNQRNDLLSKNPLVADAFFYARSKFFLEKSFKNHFDVSDTWYRYEYQHRGSIHVHGIAWLKNAPTITNNMTEKEKEVAIEYYNKLISCQNPNIQIKPSLIHPCQLSLDEVDNLEDDLCQLINQVQRHTKCRRSHCLRQCTKTKKVECRYKFPKPLVDETSLEVKDGHVFEINFSRNDSLVNKYST
ncbi:hypothetical protein FOCC_FOCC002071 [Frankliniella occidentalis]|nr:hypothetical protein FOCC_FOCC002071 [Frankliniella occidentalis]